MIEPCSRKAEREATSRRNLERLKRLLEEPPAPAA
jgi:hypothetical protein